MDATTVIGYFVATLIMSYMLGLTAVWALERKRNTLYQQMKKQIRYLEKMRLTMAVFHAKNYKIMEDYRRAATEIERMKNFILENLLFMGKRNSKDVSLGIMS